MKGFYQHKDSHGREIFWSKCIAEDIRIIQGSLDRSQNIFRNETVLPRHDCHVQSLFKLLWSCGLPTYSLFRFIIVLQIEPMEKIKIMPKKKMMGERRWGNLGEIREAMEVALSYSWTYEMHKISFLCC